MTPARLLVLFWLLVSLAGHAQAQHIVACGTWQARVQAPALRYDPERPVDLVRPLEFLFEETADDTDSNIGQVCHAAVTSSIYFWKTFAVGDLHHQLDFDIEAPDGQSVLYDSDPNTLPPRRFMATAQDSRKRQDFRLRIPAGQFDVPSGEQTLDVAWRTQSVLRNCHSRVNRARDRGRRFVEYADCGPYYTQPSTGDGRIAVHVVDSLLLRIAGAGRRYKVDFGALESGERRHFVVQSRAMRPFRISVRSAESGALVLGDGADASSRIPYRMQVDGTDIDLSRMAELAFPDARGDDMRFHRVELVIGSVARKRAGIYKDRLTLTIEPLL